MSRVLVIGDTHCPTMLEGYVDHLQEVHSAWDCDRVVHIGDLVDWASISYHPKAPSLKNSEFEFGKAMEQVQELYDAFPEADWMIGNHDALTERNALDCGMPLSVLRNYTELWEIPGWTAHERYSDLIIDDVIYRHGDRGLGGRCAAYRNAQTEFQSIVQGHLHASANIVYGANRNARYFGMQVGSGVDYRLAAHAYGVKYSAKPILSCGVVIDGVPILEVMDLGKSGVLK